MPRSVMPLRKTSLAIIAVGVGLSITNGYAQQPDELQQLRELIEQQQQIIERQQRQHEQQQRELETLKRQVSSLRQTSELTEQAVLQTQREVAVTRQEAGRAEVEARQARQLAEQTRGGTNKEPTFATTPDKYQVSIGGNLNRHANVAGDGNQTKGYFVDSSNVATYAFLKGSVKVNDDLTLGAHLEAALQDNPATSVSQTNETPGFSITGRFFEATADSQTYGKLWFGKGFSSSFFLFEIDASGTVFGNLLSVGNTAGGLQFYSDDIDDIALDPINVWAMGVAVNFGVDFSASSL